MQEGTIEEEVEKKEETTKPNKKSTFQNASVQRKRKSLFRVRIFSRVNQQQHHHQQQHKNTIATRCFPP